jgi:hypothetical protein
MLSTNVIRIVIILALALRIPTDQTSAEHLLSKIYFSIGLYPYPYAWLWNSLPGETKPSLPVQLRKTKLKNHYNEKFNYPIYIPLDNYHLQHPSTIIQSSEMPTKS